MSQLCRGLISASSGQLASPDGFTVSLDNAAKYPRVAEQAFGVTTSGDVESDGVE